LVDGRDSDVSDAYLSDAKGRLVTPKARVLPEHQNISLESAKAIMRAAAAKSKKKAEIEAAEEKRLRLARLGNATPGTNVDIDKT
jgi:hypothetical protein